MRLSTIIVSACAFVLSAAATLNRRIPIFADFGFWGADNCEGDDLYWAEWAYGTDECGTCFNFTENGVSPYYYSSVHVYDMNPQCVLTIYTNPDCSDPGIQSGEGGCWDPQPHIGAYKVTCPWATPAAVPLCVPTPTATA